MIAALPKLDQIVRVQLVWLLIFAWLCGDAQALVIHGTGSNLQGTLTNPAQHGPWTGGDPGWNNVSASGTSFVYLGDSWVLTARHAANPTPAAPITAIFSTGSFESIPNQSYVVKNPPPSLAGGLNLTPETDLRLIRINGDPGLPPLTIATQTPPLASEVVFVSNGRMQESPQSHWNVNTSNPSQWSWQEVSSGGNYHGYTTTGTIVKRWGTNRLANAQSADYNEVFSHTLNSRTGVLPLKTGDQVTRDVITMLSTFDSGGTAYEAQAAPGDSGGAVFYKNGSQWQLAGIINSTLLYNNQPGLTAVFGDATTFANLWYYNQSYSGSISDIIGTNRGYSIMGDINLDGVVSGNGTGPAASDDVTAFVQGWSYQQGVGDINSWKRGDLNLDGRTDVADFILFRGAVSGSASGAALLSLMGGGVAVPEPATILLAALGMMSLAMMAARRLGRARRTRVGAGW